VKLATVLPAVAALALAVGCGGGEDRPERGATLVLDFAPNAVHAGIYVARAHGFDQAEGVDLHVRVPSASTDGLKLLLAQRADFAVLDIHDLALARQRALDEREDADDVATLLACEREVMDVQALLGGKVAGATAFWNVEGVALHARRPATHEFRVDDYGAPPYPELVVCATRQELDEQPALARATVAALVRGYKDTLDDPESAVEDELKANPDLDRAQLQAQLDAVSPAFVGNAPRFGALQPGVLNAWAQWEARFGIVRRPPVVAQTFDASFLPKP